MKNKNACGTWKNCDKVRSNEVKNGKESILGKIHSSGAVIKEVYVNASMGEAEYVHHSKGRKSKEGYIGFSEEGKVSAHQQEGKQTFKGNN